MKTTIKQKIELGRQEEIKYLRSIIAPSDTLLVIQKSVSKSGMTRKLKIVTSQFYDITFSVAKILQWQYKDNCLVVGGCGMDMHFHAMDCLTYALGYKNAEGLTGNGGSCINWKSL